MPSTSDKPAGTPAAATAVVPASSSTTTTAAALPPLRPFYQELRTLSGKQRLDRILARKDTMRVVRQMPVLDLYATVRDVGIEDALEIVELMSPAQIQGFLDLDGWRKDRLDPVATGRWLKAMVAANVDRAVGQLRGLDLELLTLLVKIHCTVYDLSADEQPENDVGRHSLTPDQRYLIVYGGVGGDDEVQVTLQQVLERMMARDMLFVLRLCEAVRWELPSSLEEEALRWRSGRMGDLGFLPQEDAAAIFAPLSAEQVQKPGENPPLPPLPEHDEATNVDLSTSVLLPWELLAPGASVLGEALQHADDEARDRVSLALMQTANRVHAADGQDLGDSDALRACARQVAHTAGIGAAFLSRGEPEKLPAIVAQHPVPVLFRVGYTLSTRVRDELRARIKRVDDGLGGSGLLRLDAPLREVVAGMLRPRPLLFGGLIDPRRVDYAPVQSLTELATLTRAVTEAAFRAALLWRLGATDDALNALAAAHAPATMFDDEGDYVGELPSHGQLLGTWLARIVLALPQGFAPLTETDLQHLHRRVQEGGAEVFVDAKAAAQACRRDLDALPGAGDDGGEARLAAYLDVVVHAMVEELRPAHLEARAVASVWVLVN